MRRWASTICAVAGCVLLVPSLVAGYARYALVDAEQFTNRAVSALADDDVRALAGREVTDRLVLAHEPDLMAARPLIAAAAAEAVGAPAFQRVFRLGVLDLHRAVFERREATFTLAVADTGSLVAEGLRVVRPDLARRLAAAGTVRMSLDDRTAGLARSAEWVRRLALGLTLAVVVLVALAVGLAADRLRAAAWLGAGAAVAGVVVAVAWSVGRAAVLGEVSGDDERAAAAAVWDAFLGDLRTAAWALAAAGAVLAATAGRPVAAPRELTAPRALALIGGGALVILEPQAAVTVAVSAAGVLMVYAGAGALLRRVTAAGVRRVVPAALTGLLLAVLAAAFVAGGGASASAPAIDVCNGHRELCDRPLDRLALPATHNSMSAPAPGWYSSEQDAPIADQLADGVRGLLIDTHYGERLPNGRVRTVLDAGVAKLTGDDVSPAARNAALRMRERLGFRGRGERGVYLCHTLCELGATPLADALEDVRRFLVSHPGDVVAVINEDYIQPADYDAALRRAGLAPYVWDGRSATLGELVQANRRLILFSEHRGSALSPAGYERSLQETPYAFKRPSDFSCAPNRGVASAPLLLLNHWITTDPAPLPSNAAKVNARSVLLPRARACAAARGHAMNLVAVNFYRRGDLFAVVDELNGVS